MYRSNSFEEKKFIKNLIDNATFFESQYYPLFVENQSLKDQLIVIKNRMKGKNNFFTFINSLDRKNELMDLARDESSTGDDRKLVK